MISWQKRLTEILGQEQVFTDDATCWAYGGDNSRRLSPPEAVVFAMNTEQVAKAVDFCAQAGIPLTPRGRGTATTGAAVPAQGGVVLSLERMRQVGEVDAAARAVWVEPGVLNAALGEALGQKGFFWPPDPSSAAYCTTGGNIATNAGGPHTLKYGATRQNVLALEAVTGAGEVIHAGFGVGKTSVGYDLVRLLVGSEGTLAVVTMALLKLTPKPACRKGLILAYENTPWCALALSAIGEKAQPSALEFMDAASLLLVEKRRPGLVPPGARAMLLAEADGDEETCENTLKAMELASLNPGRVFLGRSEDMKSLWGARKALSAALRDIAPLKINEDIVVPLSRLPELLAKTEVLSSVHGIPVVNFGHGGDGNIHVNLLLDQGQKEAAKSCLDALFSEVIALGGTLSGEHGIGESKKDYLPQAVDAATLGLMKRIKSAFDPQGILNPGKIFP